MTEQPAAHREIVVSDGSAVIGQASRGASRLVQGRPGGIEDLVRPDAR